MVLASPVQGLQAAPVVAPTWPQCLSRRPEQPPRKPVGEPELFSPRWVDSSGAAQTARVVVPTVKTSRCGNHSCHSDPGRHILWCSRRFQRPRGLGSNHRALTRHTQDTEENPAGRCAGRVFLPVRALPRLGLLLLLPGPLPRLCQGRPFFSSGSLLTCQVFSEASRPRTHRMGLRPEPLPFPLYFLKGWFPELPACGG